MLSLGQQLSSSARYAACPADCHACSFPCVKQKQVKRNVATSSIRGEQLFESALMGPVCQPLTSATAVLFNVQVHEARQFTDTANFTLRCKDCQLPVKGEKEAIAHAKATGHANFGEF